MLRLKRPSASLWSFGVPRRGERCLCRAGQNRLSNWQPISAALSADSSLSVTQRHPIRENTSRKSAPKPTVGRAQLSRASIRRYSSQAVEEPELTTFLGEDDADYLQGMVALGSSISQASDLAPIKVQLAMPNIPMTVKTIGAKVIIAALEQRQQWALLPALLSIPEFRRLAEVKNYGVGEQLFAALLRGQFMFASRREGAAPDIFRTLDLAAKCNALHVPAVSHAVRAGYHALGLECPTRITELLDIGLADAASLQRLMRGRDNNDEDGNYSSEPIGCTTGGRLTIGRFMGQIIRARKTQSAYAVLPEVLASLPRVHDLSFKDRQHVLGTVCGRTIYAVPEVQGLARTLGTVPDPFLWSQVTTNAIHKSGPTDAAAIVQYVYENVPDGFVGYHAVHHTIVTLVGRDYSAVPSRESVQLAWKLFELHRTKGGDRALYLRKDPPASLMPLVSAFMADINIPEREAAVAVICRYNEKKKLFADGDKFGETWAGVVARFAASRCTSHLDAIEAALREPGGPLTEGDLRGVFGFIMRFRYGDATTVPIAALLRVLDFARDKGFVLDHYYTWTYIKSISSSLLRLHADMGAGLLPIVSIGASDQTVPEQHFSQALAAIQHVESLCNDPDSGLESDSSINSAIFIAYSVHSAAPDDSARLRSVVLSNPTTAGRHGHETAGLRLITNSSTYKELTEVWAALSSQGLSQNIALRCGYAEQLLRVGSPGAAIEFARRYIPDDPNELKVVRFMAWLLLSTQDTQFRLAARETLPITASDPRTREALNKVVAHRRRIGLKKRTNLPDI